MASPCSRRHPAVALAVFASAGGLLLAGSLGAQTLYGNLTGNVTDTSNAAVPGATITATSPATGLTRTVITDTSGNYQITDLPQGLYTVTITGTGFGTAETKAVPIAVNQTKRVDAALTIGGVATSVDVNTAPPALQTDRADVNYEISSTQVTQLPTAGSSGRNFQNLFRLIPGIPPPQEMNSQAGNPGRTEAVNANGVANTVNSTKIDGASVGYPWLQSEPSYIPPQDAIESANIVTNSFNAEQGEAGGISANIIVKTGTNTFHGSAWEYNSISQFNARNYFTRYSNTPRTPKNIYNEYGGNIGGPIIRNKLFFFFDYNKVSQRQFRNANQFSLPPVAFRNGDFSSVASTVTIYDPLTGNPDGTGRTPFLNNIIPTNRLSPAAVKLLSLVPNPNAGTATTIASNFVGGAVLALDRGTYDTKVSYNPSDKSTFFGRYSLQRSLINDPVALGAAVGNTYDGGQPGTAPGQIQNIGLGATHTFTPNFLIDGNAGFVRINLAAQGPDYGTNEGLGLLGIPGTNGTTAFQSGLPGFIFGTTLSSLGNYIQSNPFHFRDMQYTGNLNGTYIRGNHTFRFGGEYTHSAINHLQTNNSGARGQFNFSCSVTGSNGVTGGGANATRCISDLLLGLPNQVGKTVQLFQPNGPRFSAFGFFAQDTWKASANLTLNYGVRYEYYPFANRDHTGVFQYQLGTGNVLIGGRGNTPTNDGEDVGKGLLVPRLGVNYRIDEKTVIRSGFGITVDPENYRFFRDSYPALTTLSQTGANNYTPAAALSAVNNVLPSGTLGVGIPTVVTPDISSGVVALPYNYTTQFAPQKWRRGYIETWNLFVDRDIRKGIVGTVGYVGTHHVRQVVGLDANSGYVNPLGTATRPVFANAAAAGGARRNVNQLLDVQPLGTVNYSGLQVQLIDRQLKSFQFGYAYTYSHALNFYDTNSTLGNVTFSGPGEFGRNYGNSTFDRTHINALWTVYQLPIGAGRQYLNAGLAGRVFGGFDFTTITLYDSGQPFQLTDSSQSGNGTTAVPFQISPLAITGVKYQAGATVPTYFVNNGNIQTIGAHYGTSFTTNAATGLPSTLNANGNVGRDTVRGPGLFNLDVSLTRNIALFREYTLVLKAESFDVTNTPQFSNPASNANGGANFGQVTTSNASRSLRFSGRFSF